MITLQRPDPKVSAFLGENKGVAHGDAVRPSQFALPLRLGARRVVFSTLTKQCVETDYFDWFEHPEERVFDADDVEMAMLLKRDFLVAPGLDEAKRYVGLVKFMRASERQEAGYVGYVILPTTACNARCVYCYEEGMAYQTMSDEVVEQTIGYIHRTRREGARVDFRWFGGEPLMGERVIDKISAAMREAEVPYVSSMVTNGSLMTVELAQKAKQDWHLKQVQITLDGREEMYCARKRYAAFPGSPYRAVMNGIHALLDQKISVSIRMNVDEGNLDEMMLLVDELEEEFAQDGLISAYCHSIFLAQGDEPRSNDVLYEKMASLSEKLHGFNSNRLKQLQDEEEAAQLPAADLSMRWGTGEGLDPEEDEGSQTVAEAVRHYDRRGFMRRYFCMVDSPSSGGVILPNGDICLCEHVGDVPVVGSVFDDKPWARDAFIRRGREQEERCAACAMLPLCSDFMSCPTQCRDCYEEQLVVEKNNLRRLETEERLPPITISVDGRIIRVAEPTAAFAQRCTGILADDYLRADETVTLERAERIVAGNDASEEDPESRAERLRAWAAAEKEFADAGKVQDPPKFLVLEEQKLAYLVNSKVACSSIKASMIGEEVRDDYSVHSLAERRGLMRASLDEPSNYHVFTFVRNPFARLVSCYVGKYHTDIRSGKKARNEFEHYLGGYLKDDRGFDQFVHRVCEIPWRLMDRHFMPQYNLVFAEDGTCRCDFVGKLESIAKEYEPIRKRYALQPLPHFNASHAQDWREYYTVELAHKVYQKYRNDFEHFGYEGSYQELLDYLERREGENNKR